MKRILIISLILLALVGACGEKTDLEKTEERLIVNSNLSKVIDKSTSSKSGWTMWQIVEIIKRIESLESKIEELNTDDVQLQKQRKMLEKKIKNLDKRISDACELINATGENMRYFQSEFSNYGMIPKTCF